MPGWLRGWASAFDSGCDPGVWIQSHIELLVGSLLLSLLNLLPLSLSLSLTLINKIIIKKTTSICTLPIRCSPSTYRHQQIESQGMENHYDANGYQKKAGGLILISDKWDLKPKPGGHLVAQWLSICLRLRVWFWDPRIESHISLPMGSLPLTLLCSFLCFSV